MFSNTLFRKVTIVGVGLIGGSIGMALKKNGLAKEVVGYSQKASSLALATKNKAIDVASHDLKKSVQNADLVVLCTPVNTITKMLPAITNELRRGCVVTDVGSTKAGIVETAEKYIPSGFFVGSHPLAGSEKKGAAYATPDLFNNSICILTPTQKTNTQATERVHAFWTRIGATVKRLTPAEHDRVVAYTSHLPHVLAYGLMGTIPKEYLEYAAQGFKDATRIASSSPQMWNDICLSNMKPLVNSLDELVKNLSHLRKCIDVKDEKALIEFFTKAKEKRDGIG
jgi:prephenate dehydrogenase